MSELIFEPDKIYEFAQIDNFRVSWRLKYVETVFNPVNKEIRLHFYKLEGIELGRGEVLSSPRPNSIPLRLKLCLRSSSYPRGKPTRMNTFSTIQFVFKVTGKDLKHLNQSLAIG